jgi:hypothetical protein
MLSYAMRLPLDNTPIGFLATVAARPSLAIWNCCSASSRSAPAGPEREGTLGACQGGVAWGMNLLLILLVLLIIVLAYASRHGGAP